MRVGHAFFSKECNVLRSFAFFAKECCVLCILLRSLQKNVAFFAFFYVLKKRMQKSPKTRKKERKRTLRSLCSFAFLIKECGVLCVLLRSL